MTKKNCFLNFDVLVLQKLLNISVCSIARIYHTYSLSMTITITVTITQSKVLVFVNKKSLINSSTILPCIQNV